MRHRVGIVEYGLHGFIGENAPSVRSTFMVSGKVRRLGVVNTEPGNPRRPGGVRAGQGPMESGTRLERTHDRRTGTRTYG
jgi:hypothetical protein